MPFKFEKTTIDGLTLIKPQIFKDERGYFLETFKASDFGARAMAMIFKQDNHSMSDKGVLRGLHFQLPPFDQGKLVYVVSGRVWDVTVDLRRGSSSFLKWHGDELSGENMRMLYIPPGFAHGFISLEDETHFLYKCTDEYSPDAERGIRYDDPRLGISWPSEEIHISEKDSQLPFYQDMEMELQQGI